MSELKRSAWRGALAALCLFAVVLCCVQASAAGQSGRRKPGSPTTTPPQGESESGSEPEPSPTPASSKASNVAVSFIVMDFENVAFDIDFRARDGVVASFVDRLEQSASVAVKRGGRGTRKDARDVARKEEEAFVVLFQLEEESPMAGTTGAGREQLHNIVVRTYIYAPKTGELKYTDTIYQRPVRTTTEVGGVRVPVPSRRVQRYPSQHELEQAGRDAADRLLSRFHITLPPVR